MTHMADSGEPASSSLAYTREDTLRELRKYPPLRMVLFGLTVASGMIDAVSYLGLGHIFTANMTGNIVLLGFALAGEAQTSVAGALLAIACFVIGAALGGELARRLDLTGHRWVALAITLEAALLIIAAFIGLVAPGGNAPLTGANLTNVMYVIIALLALAMGIRNATVRRLAIPDLTTTVLTLTLTGLAADLILPGSAAREATSRRALALLSLFAGALVGAVIFLRSGRIPALVAVALLVLAIAGVYAYVTLFRKR